MKNVRGNEKEQQQTRFSSIGYTKTGLAQQVRSLSIGLLTPMEFSPRSSLLRRQVEQEP